MRTRIVADDPYSAALIKPYLRGEDLRVWYQRESDLYLLFARRGINIDNFPGALKHLQNFKPQLEPRPRGFADTENWIGRKPGQYSWYEIQDSVDYYGAFEAPRIHSTKVTLFPTFSLLEATAYAGNTSYVLPLADVAAGNFLLGILNSRVSEYYSRSVFAPKANGYYEVQPEPLARIPIPDAPAAEREAIGALAMQITEEARARYALHRRTMAACAA